MLWGRLCGQVATSYLPQQKAQKAGANGTLCQIQSLTFSIQPQTFDLLMRTSPKQAGITELLVLEFMVFMQNVTIKAELPDIQFYGPSYLRIQEDMERRQGRKLQTMGCNDLDVDTNTNDAQDNILFAAAAGDAVVDALFLTS